MAACSRSSFSSGNTTRVVADSRMASQNDSVEGNADDGVISIAHTAADLGQGIYNMIGIVAATTLGLDQKQIRVEKPDTSTMLLTTTISKMLTVGPDADVIVT